MIFIDFSCLYKESTSGSVNQGNRYQNEPERAVKESIKNSENQESENIIYTVNRLFF